MTTLRFSGDWTVWLGLLVALGLAAGAGLLYWRETRAEPPPRRWLLPALRALAVFLLVLIFTGPILRHTRVIGEFADVLLFVDASASMGLGDEPMDIHRKLLVARSRGWLPPEAYDPALRTALDQLAFARQAAASAVRSSEDAALRAAPRTVGPAIQSAADALARANAVSWPAATKRLPRFRKDVLAPARALLAAETPTDLARLASDLNLLADLAARWERELQKAYADYSARLLAGTDTPVRKAIERFDRFSRWQRLESLLADNTTGLLARLAAQHRVHLTAATSHRADPLWEPGPAAQPEAIQPPARLAAAPTNRLSDLNAPIRAGVDALPVSDRVAVVLFSDGQHNAGASPAQVAKILGNRGIPLFTVGLGAPEPPPDLAVLQVTAPQSVFIEDRVKGEVQLKDELPPGQSFTLKIEHQDRVVWAKTLIAEQQRRRSVAFDFPVKDLAQARLVTEDRDLKLNSVPLELTVSAVAIAPERETRNNDAPLRFQAARQRPRVLLLDGRPRWEFRYLRNLFERDEQWDVNALLAGAGGGESRPWPRGPGPGRFPADRETLFGYHLIMFGELPPGLLRPPELEWIREFVEKRGGGVIFIDGRQEPLASHLNSPLAPLLPVGWQGHPLGDAPVQLKLTARGGALTPLTLVANPAENTALWSALPGPRWSAATLPLPGTEVLLTAVSGERSLPALVFRRFGAGRVLYAASDESWRWRYEVADRHHQRFWNQVARWIMDAPYPVQDKHVALDSGPIRYAPDESADIRALVRDAQGRLLTRARVEAQLFRGGQRVAVIPLAADEAEGGVYRGRTAPLAEGDYEVRVRVEGLPESDLKARTAFRVEPEAVNELAELHCDEELLRQMAALSGGEYFREEDAGRLVERLQPLSRGKVVESQTLLWQSGWWFGAVLTLLAVEWVLRKRAGML
jgi:hypothetical protein